MKYSSNNTLDDNLKNNENPLPLVGIGASAGGLNALKQFFHHVPEDSGIAWVVVVHLSPQHKSVLAELLQPHIKMPVNQVTKTIALEPNTVYVIPPNANLNTIDTHLRLTELEERRSERAPIDHFFRTLAHTHKSKATGIVLTGTGSDGTLGIKEIKEYGGLTIAQNPHEAEYDGMPQSAIATGIIDLVLPIAEMPQQIVNFMHTQPRTFFLEKGKDPDTEENKLIQKIFSQLKSQTGRDFSSYKLSTIVRRMERRMQIYQLVEVKDYLELLKRKPGEAKSLADDFLINVTNFFRDPEVFEYLELDIIPKVMGTKGPEEQVRIWSIGCATGEEAYSMAILLKEATDKMEFPPTVQLFASDLHDISLRKAREGFFPGEIKNQVSNDRLHRFFMSEDGGYRVKKELREMVIFTSHNLLSDPPFSKLDLIICRNLLIYLKKEVQINIFELMHYSLLPDGILLLGPSENIENNELFAVRHKDYSVYTRMNVTSPEPRLPVFPHVKIFSSEEGYSYKRLNQNQPGKLHHKVIERYGPPSILLSTDYQILHISETAGRYLYIPGGQPSKDIFRLLKKELILEMRSAIHTSRDTKKAARSKPVTLNIEGMKKQVILSTRVIEEEAGEHVILITFDEYVEPDVSNKNNSISNDDFIFTRRIEELEEELQNKRQQLQGIIEEYETSREEMKASNEELQSANEELRSTMEELETSKEELQSLNEELITLNQENRHKVEELSQVSGDLENLLAATDIATLFISSDLRIMRYTPKINELFNIRPADKGRPISDITNKVGYSTLVEDSQKVIHNLQSILHETKDQNGNCYMTRLMPYRSEQNKIDGVVITFIDITDRKYIEEKIAKNEERFRAIVNNMFNMLYRMNPDWREMYELEGKGFIQDTVKPDKLWMDKYIPTEDQPLVKAAYKKAVANVDVYKLDHRVKRIDGTIGWISSRALPLLNENGEIREWLGAAMDITADKKSKEKLKNEKEFAESIIETLHEPLLILNHDLIVISANAAFFENFNVNKKKTIGQLIYKLGNNQWDIPQLRKLLEEVLPEAQIFNDYEVEHQFENYGNKTMLFNARRLDNLQLILLGIRDITEQKIYEKNLQQAKEIAEEAARIKEQFLTHMSHEIRTPLNSIVGLSYLMLEQPHNELQAKNLSTLKTAAENLHQLINDILDYSKLKSGKWKLNNDVVLIRNKISELEMLHKHFVSSKNINLEIFIADDVPELIIADESKLMQILNNLLSNAIKFTEQGTVKLEILLKQRKNKNHLLMFSVNDTGIGIQKTQLKEIFDEFNQLDLSTVKKYKGTGLGLSIVKMYLNIMNSEIFVESTAGEGSRFWFELPVREAANHFSSDTVLDSATQKVDLQNYRILIVEDDDFSRMVLSEILNIWGVSHDVATNGLEAVEIAKKNHYHIILMDVHMPGMDGIEATRNLRKMELYKSTPIVAITADASSKVTKEVKNRLFSNKLIKPFDPDRLQEVLKTVLSNNIL